MQYFPLFLDLRGRDVLVVGGSGAVVRKALALAKCGARVTVVAEKPDEAMTAAVESGQLRVLWRPFAAADLEGRTLVVAAGEDEATAVAVSAAARERAVPVNVVDQPSLSTFLWPAIVDRDPLVVAVCSGGAAPVMARSVRARIESLLPANLGRLARFADGFRSAVKATRHSGSSRRRFWERFFEGPIAAQVLAGDERGAREQMLCKINRSEDAAADEGTVSLVGAGPGDPELLTLKALRLLQEADVIVHDRLVGPRILEYARRDADCIDVGKAPGRHSASQDQIHALLLSQARAGRRVVRLKGGDPFVFGRGGEEREFLLRHGVRVDVVPGITAATGCAAAAGIPLTLRGEAQTLSIVTGQGEDGDPALDWPALAQERRTLCIYMGVGAAGRIAARLIAHGRDAATPTAVVVNGTLPEQQILTGQLRELPILVSAAGSAPALIIIGEVVRRADAWNQPAAYTGPAMAALNWKRVETIAMSEAESKSSKRASDEGVLALSTARGARGAALKAVTANRLADGLVVYLGAEGRWVENIADALSVVGKEAGAALLGSAEPDVEACRIVGPYLIDVVAGPDGKLRGTSERERIRALGPTVRPDLGKQVEV